MTAKHADDAKGMQVAQEQTAIGGLGRAEEEFHEEEEKSGGAAG